MVFWRGEREVDVWDMDAMPILRGGSVENGVGAI